jgi:hypothetical protein
LTPKILILQYFCEKILLDFWGIALVFAAKMGNAVKNGKSNLSSYCFSSFFLLQTSEELFIFCKLSQEILSGDSANSFLDEVYL